MSEVMRPTSAAEVLDAVRWAVAEETPLELVGAGTKRALGRPVQAAATLDLSGLTGIELYEPEELVLQVRPGTKLAEVEALLADNGQALAFEPPDLGPLFGGPAAAGTIGGVISAGLSGPRRVKAGAARDHVLGLSAVSGRGAVFKAGGRVVKNVTGYDLPKLLTGAYGTLAALTSVTLKVLPRPEDTLTLLLPGIDQAAAPEAMAGALGSPYEVSGAAYLPAETASRSSALGRLGRDVVALRLEGVAPGVADRAQRLKDLLGEYFETVDSLRADRSRAFWAEVRDVQPLLGRASGVVWRLSVTPSEGPAVLRRLGGRGYCDWGGGLVWAALPVTEDGGEAVVRAAAAAAGGHATLMRASGPVRAGVEVFEPRPAALALLEARVKDAFDPKRLLNPGRMYAGL